MTSRAAPTAPARSAFTEWSQGSSITLSRFDGYWGDPACVAEVTFQYFTDPNAAVNALTSGDADMLTGVNTDLVGQLEGDPTYVVSQGTTNGEVTLGFNNSKAPLDDQAVRMAIRQAIDKQGVLDLYNGYGTLIGGPVPPTDPWYEDLNGVAPYDPDAARAALEGAGVAEGTPLTLVYPNIYPTNLAEYIASQLGDVGLEIEIQIVEFSVWLEQVYTNADYDLTVVIHVEPHDLANYANPDYYWRYDNPEVQDLIADARTAPSPEESTELLREATRIISEDAAADWLLLLADLTVAREGVSGYPTERHRLPVRRVRHHGDRLTDLSPHRGFVTHSDDGAVPAPASPAAGRGHRRHQRAGVRAAPAAAGRPGSGRRRDPGLAGTHRGAARGARPQPAAVEPIPGLGRRHAPGRLRAVGLNNATVTSELGKKLTITAPLVIVSTVLSIIVAVPLGIFAAARHRHVDGMAVSAIAQLGIALPTFWVGLMLATVVGARWRWLPAQGFPRDGWDDPGAPSKRWCCRRSRWRCRRGRC